MEFGLKRTLRHDLNYRLQVYADVFKISFILIILFVPYRVCALLFVLDRCITTMAAAVIMTRQRQNVNRDPRVLGQMGYGPFRVIRY